MSAGFRRPDSQGRLFVPAVRNNNATPKSESRGQSSNKLGATAHRFLPTGASFLSKSPKYHRLRLKDDQVERKGSRHHNNQQQTYVFGHVDTADEEEVDDEDKEVDDDEEIDVFELPEIRSRKFQGTSSTRRTDSTGGFSEPAYVQHQVINGDTIQSLSIKYACPISELKRVNHLIRDQDLFGLKHIKVPVKKYGIISETCEQNNLSADATQSASSQKNCTDRHNESRSKHGETWTDVAEENHLHLIDTVDSDCNLSDPDTQRRVIQTLSIRDMMQSQTKEAEEFLRNMDRDLEILRESTRTNRHSLDEVISVLTNKSIQPLNKGSSRLLCAGEGADCGLRYKNIVLVVLSIAVIVPLLLLLYFKYIMHMV